MSIRPSVFIIGNMILCMHRTRLYVNRLRTFGHNLSVWSYGLEVGCCEDGDEQGFKSCGMWRVFWVIGFRTFNRMFALSSSPWPQRRSIRYFETSDCTHQRTPSHLWRLESSATPLWDENRMNLQRGDSILKGLLDWSLKMGPTGCPETAVIKYRSAPRNIAEERNLNHKRYRWNIVKHNLYNHLTPNGHFSGRIAPLTYRCCIFYLFNKYTYWIS
jgi:hypothetical protein